MLHNNYPELIAVVQDAHLFEWIDNRYVFINCDSNGKTLLNKGELKNFGSQLNSNFTSQIGKDIIIYDDMIENLILGKNDYDQFKHLMMNNNFLIRNILTESSKPLQLTTKIFYERIKSSRNSENKKIQAFKDNLLKANVISIQNGERGEKYTFALIVTYGGSKYFCCDNMESSKVCMRMNKIFSSRYEDSYFTLINYKACIDFSSYLKLIQNSEKQLLLQKYVTVISVTSDATLKRKAADQPADINNNNNNNQKQNEQPSVAANPSMKKPHLDVTKPSAPSFSAENNIGIEVDLTKVNPVISTGIIPAGTSYLSALKAIAPHGKRVERVQVEKGLVVQNSETLQQLSRNFGETFYPPEQSKPVNTSKEIQKDSQTSAVVIPAESVKKFTLDDLPPELKKRFQK